MCWFVLGRQCSGSVLPLVDSYRHFDFVMGKKDIGKLKDIGYNMIKAQVSQEQQ